MRLNFTSIVVAIGLFVCGVSTPLLAQVRLSAVTRPDNVHLLVAESGDPKAPGILFIHGFAQSYLSFRHQFSSELAAKYHMVAFDLRGHGGSDKPSTVEAYADSKIWADDVAAVIAATGLKRPIIVGWSYGGFVAMDYVRHYGVKDVAGIEMVGSLGGLAGAPKTTGPDTDAARAIRANSERSRSLDLLDNIRAGKQTAAGYVTPNMSAEDRDVLFATEMMMPSRVRRLMTARRLANADVVLALTGPVLFVRGSRDMTMPMEALETLLRTLPNAKLSAYADTGHLTFVEQPERFNRELAAFADASGAR